MKKSIKKFLEFNGKTLYVLNADGQYWVALRPICEALEISYTWQFKKAKKHPLYRDVLSNPTMHDAQNRLQKMVALPERYIYLWIAQLPIKSKDHLIYVRKCVDLIYDYFHGSITNRNELLGQKAILKKEREELETILSNEQAYQQLKKINQREKSLGKKLAELDRQVISEKQLSLFN